MEAMITPPKLTRDMMVLSQFRTYYTVRGDNFNRDLAPLRYKVPLVCSQFLSGEFERST